MRQNQKKSKRRRSDPKQRRRGDHRPRTSFLPETLGEAIIIALVIAVPLVINARSRNLCDVKDVVLGLGAPLGLSMWLLASLARGRLSWLSSRLNLSVAAFVAWSAVTILYSRYPYATISEFGRLAAHFALFLLAIASLRTPEQVKRVIGAACLASIAVSIYAFQQAAGRDFITYTTEVTRVLSFLGNPTYLGGYLILLIPPAVALGWPIAPPRDSVDDSSRRPPPGRASVPFILWSAFFLAAAVMMAIALYLSYTLSAIIGLGMGTAIAFLLYLIRGGWKAARVAVPLALAAAIVLAALGFATYLRMPDKQRARIDKVLHFQDPYAEERQLHWRTATELFREAPWLGNGYGSFRIQALERMAAEWYKEQPTARKGMLVPGYAHNEYLQILADSGIVGGAIFFVLLIASYGLAVRLALQAETALWRRLGLALTVAFTAFFFQNSFGITFRQTGSVTLFWLWLALLVLGTSALPRKDDAAPGPRLRELTFRPRSPAVLALLALVLLSLLALLSWIAIRPVLASVRVRYSQYAAGIGNFQASAEAARETVQLCPYSFLGYYSLGYAEGQLGDYEASLEANQKALELLPGNAPVYYNMGITYRMMGKLNEAEKSLREAVRLQPTAMDHHAGLAEVLISQGKLKEAAEPAREAARLAPRNPKVYLLLADIYGRQADYPNMATYLEKAGRLQPTDVAIHKQVSELWLSVRRYDKAAAAARRWVLLDPKSANAHEALGFATYKLGNPKAAAKSLKRALELKPGYAKARLHLAYAYIALGKSEAATPLIRWVAERTPNTPEGREARAVLESARRRHTASQANPAVRRTDSVSPRP